MDTTQPTLDAAPASESVTTDAEVTEIEPSEQERIKGVIQVSDDEKALADTVKKYGRDNGMSFDQQLALIKRTMFQAFTTSEILITFRRANAIGADLFAKELWAYKDKEQNLILVLSRQFLGKKAEENPEFDGLQSGVVYEKDVFEMDTFSGEIIHKIKPNEERGAIKWAWAVAWRKNGKPSVIYAQAKDYDKKQYIWKSHADAMMQKCAESIVLRKFAMLWSDVLGEGEFTPIEESPNPKAPKVPQRPDMKKLAATLSKTTNPPPSWAIQ